MSPEVEECFRTIIKNRKPPKIEPSVDGKSGFLYFDKDGNITARDVASSFGESASIQIDVSSETMRAGSDDLIFAEISVLDEAGNPVRNACNRMKVDVSGAGRLVGLDNGDSTDEDSYKAVSRRLFNGKLLAIIAPSDSEGVVSLKVSSRDLWTAK
jgi:beta-galactosidase